MPRQEIRLGHSGDISYTAVKKNGKAVGWRARTMFHDLDGVHRPVERTGKSKSLAKDRLQEALDERQGLCGDGIVTPETTVSELADLWLGECELDEGMKEGSVNLYRREIEPSDVGDARAKATDTKIKVTMGNVKIKDLTTPLVDRHVMTIVGRGHRVKARRHVIVLRGMCALAVRHGAIKDNPVRDLKPIRSNRPPTVAMEIDQIIEFRAQLQRWLAGESVPGTPAFTTGCRRNPKVVQVADILLGTGARPGEGLALRRCDIDTSVTPWRATIAGTIVYVKGKGYFRQGHTKTGESGRRTVHLPGFAMAVLEEMGASGWTSDDEALIFPNRDGGVWSFNTFGRLWREARGTSFAWVKPKTFRATVATLIAEEEGIAVAAEQLGHVPGSKITPLHYIMRKKLAPDSSSILQRAIEVAA